MEKKKEADRIASEKAKEKYVKEEHERISRAVAGVNHLEIPAELAFLISKLDGIISNISQYSHLWSINY